MMCICDPLHQNVLISNLWQWREQMEHMGLESYWWVKIQKITSSWHILIITMKSQEKVSHIWLNLIRLCTISNSGNTHDKPNKTSTSTKWVKLTLTLTSIGAWSPIFNNNMWYFFMTRFVGTIIHLCSIFLLLYFLALNRAWLFTPI
jgi:hypothetical protein